MNMDPEERERRARLISLTQRMEADRFRKTLKLDQRLYRVDLGLGYLIYCCRRFSRRSQFALATRLGSSQSTVSKWERGERQPSLSALGAAADASGLELVLALHDPKSRSPQEDFVVVAIYRGEGRVPELDLVQDRYENDYIAPRPWRAAVEAWMAPRARRGRVADVLTVE